MEIPAIPQVLCMTFTCIFMWYTCICICCRRDDWEEYGIDWTGPVTSNEDSDVTVPDLPSLTSEQRAALADLLRTIETSSTSGEACWKSQYIATRCFITSCLS